MSVALESFVVVYSALAVEIFPAINCQKTNRTHCEAVDQKIPTGSHYLDPRNCTIYYCRETHIRHAQIDRYYCRGIDKILFDDLYADCLEKGCDTGDFLHHKVRRHRKTFNSHSKRRGNKQHTLKFPFVH